MIKKILAVSTLISATLFCDPGITIEMDIFVDKPSGGEGEIQIGSWSNYASFL